MKAKLTKLMRLLKLDVLLWALYEKLCLGLTKKLAALKNALARFLSRGTSRNG